MFQGFKNPPHIWMRLKVEVKSPLSALCTLTNGTGPISDLNHLLDYCYFFWEVGTTYINGARKLDNLD